MRPYLPNTTILQKPPHVLPKLSVYLSSWSIKPFPQVYFALLPELLPTEIGRHPQFSAPSRISCVSCYPTGAAVAEQRSGELVSEPGPSSPKFVPVTAASGVVVQSVPAVLLKGKQKAVPEVQKEPVVKGSNPPFAPFCDSFLGVFLGGSCKNRLILWARWRGRAEWHFEL